MSIDLHANVADAEGGEAERGVVRVVEDLLEVPGARAGVGVCARRCLYAEVEDDRLDAAV